MKLGEIVKDSLRYPFSDWKKIFILGLIVLIDTFLANLSPFNLRDVFSYQFFFIVLLINCFIIGYCFKIIQSSLKNTKELPKLSSWVNLFKNGFKITFIGLLYSIPAILALILLNSSVFNFYTDQPNLFIVISAIVSVHLNIVWSICNIIYFLIILPYIVMTVANMANNDGKLSYAFEFKAIFDKIKNIGWIKFYSWYLLTSVIVYLVFLVGFIIVIILNLIYTFSPL